MNFEVRSNSFEIELEAKCENGHDDGQEDGEAEGACGVAVVGVAEAHGAADTALRSLRAVHFEDASRVALAASVVNLSVPLL